MRLLLALILLAGTAGAGHAELRCEPIGHPDNVICYDPALRELLSAAEGVLPYLSAPSDRAKSLTMTYPVYIPIPTELENTQQEVERLKKKDAAIRRFREAVKGGGR